MTQNPDTAAIRAAKAIGERADLALSPEEREERRLAGLRRKRAMREVGATSYRQLIGVDLERRP
jgi:hypothetical protein